MFRLADAARVQEETNLQLSELEVSYYCLKIINIQYRITTFAKYLRQPKPLFS